MAEEIPQWAWKVVDDRVPVRACNEAIDWARYSDELRCLAAGLIAAHEKEPVDLLLGEVRFIAARHALNLSAMPGVESALKTALRRGMELERGNV